MTTTLGGSVELLDRALAYTGARLTLVRTDLLDRPTPCPGWRLADLLVHMEDALDAFTEAAGGAVQVRGAATVDGRVTVIRQKACALLGAWSRPAPGDVVLEGPGRRIDLDTPVLVGAAALEVTVHGWDVARSTGEGTRVPNDLARDLLELARDLVHPTDRGVRFAAPVEVPADASYDERLLGFLGRT